MMAQINLVGIIGKDPEYKEFTDFGVLSFPLAYTPREKKGTEWVDGETTWFRVSISGKNAENSVGLYSKGDRVLIVGTLKISKYTSKDGTEKQGLDIRNPTVAIIPTNKTPKTKMRTREEVAGWEDTSW